MTVFNLSPYNKASYFGIAIILLFGVLASGCGLVQVKPVQAKTAPAKTAQTKSVQAKTAQTKTVSYDDYGKPLSNTRGEFIVNQSVNLRSEANTNSRVMGVLPAGETVIVDGVTHGYYRITFDGKTGYSWHKFFTPK